jgi:putative peptidoglycan lipid II flippase
LFDSPKKGLFKEGMFVAIIALISKVMGVVREIALAYFFGASGAVDAYRISVTAVLLPMDTLSGTTLGNSFVPAFKRMISGRKPRLGWLLANQLMILLVGGGTICAIVLMVFSRFFVSIVAPGFDPVRAHEASVLTAYLAPMVPFFAGAVMLGFVLNSFYHFRVPALQPVVQNVGLLVAIVVAASLGSLIPLSLGMVAAYIAFAGLVVLVVRRHWTFGGWPIRKRDRKIWGYFSGAYAPLLLLSLILHGNILVDRMVSSLLAVGSVAALEYARFIVDTPMMTLGLGMVRVALPHYSDLEAKGKRTEVTASIEKLILGSLIWLLPLALFLAMASKAIVQLIYGYGRFGADAVIPTAQSLSGFSVGMWAAFGCYLMHRVYNAQRRNGILTIFCAIALSINTILNIELGPRIGVQGIAIATSISNIALFVMLLMGISWVSFQRIALQGGYLIAGAVVIRYLLDYVVPWKAGSIAVAGSVALTILIVWIPWVLVHRVSRDLLLQFIRRTRS